MTHPFEVGQVWALKSGKHVRIAGINYDPLHSDADDIEYKHLVGGRRWACYAYKAAQRWTLVSEASSSPRSSERGEP